jgi:hypothetical protein
LKCPLPDTFIGRINLVPTSRFTTTWLCPIAFTFLDRPELISIKVSPGLVRDRLLEIRGGVSQRTVETIDLTKGNRFWSDIPMRRVLAFR